mgnify:CR=1 FL=1
MRISKNKFVAVTYDLNVGEGSERELMERAEDDGMQTFDQDLFRLYINGEIDYDEALRQAESANDLRLRIKLYEEGRESTHIFERVNDLNLM